MIFRSTKVPPSEAGDELNSLGQRETTRPKKRRTLRVRLFFGMGTAALIFLLAASWLGFRAQQLQENLNASKDLITELRSELASGEIDAAKSSLSDLEAASSLARDASHDPLWRVAGAVPLIGANFTAAREISVSLSDVVDQALAPLLAHSASFDWKNLTPVSGVIDVAPIEQVSPHLIAAARTVEVSYERLNRIDRDELLPQLAEPLEEATTDLGEARAMLQAAASAAEVLPGMLGSTESREYLVLIQNSAEIRATGGIPGALAVIEAERGQLQLTAQGSATDMGRFEPPLEVDPIQGSIYSARIGRFLQSVNLTPDFPTAASTAKEMWEMRRPEAGIDGVVALDPVTLANILNATGPVELSFDDNPAVGELLASSALPTSLTAENVVQTLLSDVYQAIQEPMLQDAYFAAVASEIFDALSSGTANSKALTEALIESTEDGRLYLWSANATEQDVIRSTDLSGSVTGVGSGGAAFGAYFNDGTGAKMDYYVKRTVQLQRNCSPDGYLQYTLTTTITNTAPKNAADILPAYVTGGGVFGVPPGTVQTNFVAYGPDRSLLQTARVNGEPEPLGSHRHGDRPVGVLTARVEPGATVTLSIDFTNVVQQSEPALDVTPTVQPVNDVVLPLVGEESCH